MSVQRKAGLGRGLGALLPSNEPSAAQDAATKVAIDKIHSNPRQPRTNFHEDELSELADSIKEHGIIQPLIVAQDEGLTGTYTLIAGERRLRAAILAGLSMVPVIIRQATDREMLEIALIENVQREDLSPLETAEAYKNLEETFNMTHEEIAKRVGKKRVSVTNTIRLLRLPDDVREGLVNRKITEGHARVLLALPTEQAQVSVMQMIISQNLSVRQTEALVRKMTGEKDDEDKRPPAPKARLSPDLKAVEEELMRCIGTRVSLHPTKSGGTINLHYYSDEELNNLISRLKND